MDELIARLERATEGSCELDARIHVLLHPDQRVLVDPGSVGPSRREARYGTLADFPLDGWTDYEAVSRTISAPAYTTSIDAALTLVPEGMTWNLAKWRARGSGNRAAFWTDIHTDENHISARHDVAPLAICIAALRARHGATP